MECGIIVWNVLMIEKNIYIYLVRDPVTRLISDFTQITHNRIDKVSDQLIRERIIHHSQKLGGV